MIGAVIGEMAGSAFELNNTKTKDFALYAKGTRFTDDTVLTMATLDSLLNAKPFAVSLGGDSDTIACITGERCQNNKPERDFML